jgi:hypothetical protein
MFYKGLNVLNLGSVVELPPKVQILIYRSTVEDLLGLDWNRIWTGEKVVSATSPKSNSVNSFQESSKTIKNKINTLYISKF